MKSPAVVCAALLLASPGPRRLTAQVSVSFTAGARYTTTLVHDSIVTLLDVRPALAPALSANVGFPLSGPWRVEAMVDVSSSQLQLHDAGAGGGTTDMARLTTLGFGVGLRRRFQPWLAGRFSIGGLAYLPAGDLGLFRDGTGGPAPFGQVAVDFAPAEIARHHLALEAQGDLHKFITPALKADGFTDSRMVYRLALVIRFDLRNGEPEAAKP
ncbi:MAG TPA: hypothetical protein VMH88_13865 [Gemmatimonadales bacterium]|nr:hypothetical protein [Gemmatimonadales bacterium]